MDVIFGESRNRQAARALADELAASEEAGTIYLGYPVLATSDERIEIDALLVSPTHGLIAFLFEDEIPSDPVSWEGVIAEQDRLFAMLESNLGRHDTLRKGRHLAVVPETATVFAGPVDPPVEANGGFYGPLQDVGDWVATRDSLQEELTHALNAALQRVTTIKPRKKRLSVESGSSRGGKLQVIERSIANLDRWQQRAAIESPDGPQRIRGLAGSGKTVVLALKAAYWHTQHPTWQIALTFQSRALYQQIDDLVTRFTFEHSNDRPDPDQLRIMHSWGSRSRHGVYSMIADALGEVPRDWAYANGKYGMDDAFRGVCAELLSVAENSNAEPFFDAVLIDEAQDMPPEFFQLVYRFTKEPKRIAWGYDELQKLSESAMPSTDELFGFDESGQSLVSLHTPEGGPHRDVVLPVCYRNTPWALATAHALGIGVYREDGLLQHPDDPTLWGDIGYSVDHGTLTLGAQVTLRRAPESTPEYFADLLQSDDAVVLQSFDDQAAQDSWVAAQIATNLTTDELEHDDLLIVLPDSYTAKRRGPQLRKALARHKISAHLVGVDSSADQIFLPGSVAIAHIYRAKGNEAPMVYAIDCQKAASGFNAVTRRSTLFTAITRSRAWVRITGWGDSMAPIAAEVQAVIDNQYRLKFEIPTAEQLVELRHIHRDRPPEHEASIRKASDGLDAFLAGVERGEVELSDLPANLIVRLADIKREGDADG